MAAAQPAARDSMRENRAAAAVERVPGATRIMGVDPGLTRCGFSMLDMTADRKAHFVNVGIFAQEQVNTVIGTAHASGAVISAAAMRGVPVFFHTPSEVKAAVTGSGRADKASVGRMVTRILGLDSMPKPADAADALAIAICHGWRGGGIGSGINMAAQTQTHQGSRPVQARRGGSLTPAQRAWMEAEARARR